jgi:hypothetical protein
MKDLGVQAIFSYDQPNIGLVHQITSYGISIYIFEKKYKYLFNKYSIKEFFEVSQ